MGIKVALLTIGTELTEGLVADTNSFYLSKELFKHNYQVRRHLSVGDRFEEIVRAINELSADFDVIITTGGLGPTKDDLTRGAIAAAFNKKLSVDNQSMALAAETYLHEGAERVASFPEGATIIKPSGGTAAGFWLQTDNYLVVSLPGVPAELEDMFHRQVLPLLDKLFKPQITSRRRVFKIVNLTEMQVEAQLSDISQDLSYGLLPRPAEIHLYVTVKSSSPNESDEKLALIDKQIRDIFGRNLYGIDDETLEQVVVKELTGRKITVSVAESSTGGLVGSRLASVADASAILLGGYITYSYSFKEKMGVPKDILMATGAVSAETAAAMTIHASRQTNSDLAVSITGIAGPGGATETKPLGLHYIGVGTREKELLVREFVFKGDRTQVRWQASQWALIMLREVALNQK